jgi:choline/glycine/proline betaine transport protein
MAVPARVQGVCVTDPFSPCEMSVMNKIRYYLHEHTNPPVFLVSLVLTLALVAWGVFAPANLGSWASDGKLLISKYFGWWYLAVVLFFLMFVAVLLITPYGRIRLGKDDDRPFWNRWQWFSMLFTAGMGIGLVFYGVAEPIFHFNSFFSKGVPTNVPEQSDAAVQAMRMTIFHWGFHPWAIYIILGLAMGYFCFRHDLPLRPAAAFYPLIGKGIYGWVGHLIDILAVFGTLFGLATSLGLGASQINAGLAQVFNLPDNWVTKVAIIGLITAVAVGSLMLGVDKGIRRLSVFNMYTAVGLAIVVFIAGPTLFILNYMVQATGDYFQHLAATSLQTWAFNKEGQDWLNDWTLFYWGWWIAWSPFVGMFIARVSRGRTIREFIVGTLLAPVGASIVWFCIFGGTAIHYITKGGNPALQNAGETDALFILLSQLPLADLPGGSIIVGALSLLGILVVAIFFATSSDSGSLVVDMLTNGGDPHPIWQQRLFWACMEGAVAAVLLMAGALGAAGDPLNALRTAAILSGLPFSVVLAFMCWGLIRQLGRDSAPPPDNDAGEDPELDGQHKRTAAAVK